MAARKPLVLASGQIQQLQSGDTLDATVTEVDVIAKTNDNAGAVVIGEPVYVKSNGNIDKARANASGTTRVFGLMTPASTASGASGNVQTNGILVATTGQWDTITGGSGGLTPGSAYYLSAATAGRLTATAPSSVGEYVVKVGVASSTTDMHIDPAQPILL